MTYSYDFPMVSCAATMVVMDRSYTHVLLGKRSHDSDAYPSMWSLPGGFLNAGAETLEKAAVRELREETGLEFSPEDAYLYGVDSTPGIDPRAHVINGLYIFVTDLDKMLRARPSDDLQELAVLPLDEAKNIPMAFNHQDLLIRAIEVLG